MRCKSSVNEQCKSSARVQEQCKSSAHAAGLLVMCRVAHCAATIVKPAGQLCGGESARTAHLRRPRALGRVVGHERRESSGPDPAVSGAPCEHSLLRAKVVGCPPRLRGGAGAAQRSGCWRGGERGGTVHRATSVGRASSASPGPHGAQHRRSQSCSPGAACRAFLVGLPC
eukprot:scaffold38633_cov73-Phaeocystis_antarctica.AAC.2